MTIETASPPSSSNSSISFSIAASAASPLRGAGGARAEQESEKGGVRVREERAPLHGWKGARVCVCVDV
jgi:hypothetical protein